LIDLLKAELMSGFGRRLS